MENILFSSSIRVNDAISIHIPTVGEIYDNEDAYYTYALSWLATPYDMMVQLEDAHIDFTAINDFQLFLILFDQIKRMDSSLVFGDLDLSKFVVMQNEANGEYLVRDPETGVCIDRSLHALICKHLRRILNIPRNDKRPGNAEAKRYMLERARLKLKRQARKQRESQLETYIIALVNTEQFPYNYTTVRDMTIYQFYASMGQISHKIKFDNLMIGYYAGTIKEDSLKAKDKTWVKT